MRVTQPTPTPLTSQPTTPPAVARRPPPAYELSGDARLHEIMDEARRGLGLQPAPRPAPRAVGQNSSFSQQMAVARQAMGLFEAPAPQPSALERLLKRAWVGAKARWRAIGGRRPGVAQAGGGRPTAVRAGVAPAEARPPGATRHPSAPRPA